MNQNEAPSVVYQKPLGYSVKDTLECGQCFRYESYIASDGEPEYYMIASAHTVRIREDAETVSLFGCADEEECEFWRSFLALDVDWNAIKEEVAELCGRESLLAEAAKLAGGIAILRQDPLEALLSFIISQNNNIPRIRGIVRRLCAAYGKQLIAPNEDGLCPCGFGSGKACDRCGACFSFPTCEDILTNPEPLSTIGLGFRLRYILDAVARVSSGEVSFDSVRAAGDLLAAETELRRICGVGKKVADCVLLFSLGYTNAFPIDVWIEKAKERYIGDRTPESLGRYAGIAQQYIYHHARNISQN